MELTVDLAKRIGDRLKVNWNAITPDTLAKGAKVELEHEDVFPDKGGMTIRNAVIACKIALAHLKERPDYYIKLADMEKSPLVVKKPDEPLVRQEYKNVIEGLIDEVLSEMRYPTHATDYNRLRDADGFWRWGIKDAADAADLKDIGGPFKSVGELILWLNYAASAWEKHAKMMGQK